jgi:DNA-binding CsgD family transcriptional regulator
VTLLKATHAGAQDHRPARTYRYGELPALTNAERETLTLLATGHTPADVAVARCVTLATVRSQIKSAKAKLEAKTTEHLVALALTQQLITLPE